MLKEVVLNCDFDSLLLFANSQAEKTRAKKQNKFLGVAPYPLTKNFLLNYYFNSDFDSYKKTFKDPQCAAQCYSYFVSTYGYVTEGEATKANKAFEQQSSGLGIFGGLDLNLGFSLKELFFNYWYLLLIAGYFIIKKND